MQVFIPENLKNERIYILDILLKDNLGLNYEIKFHNSPQYIIEFNGKKIIIKDAFFYKFKTPEEYLKPENIPEKVTYAEYDILPERDMPVFFGDKHIFFDENSIICEMDIIAEAFFMLTRWEEYVIKDKDKHSRFPEEKSFTIKYRIYKRPIVNEYVELLRNCFAYLGLKIDNKNFYTPFITHDIDLANKFSSFLSFSKTFLGDLLKNKDIEQASFTLKKYFNFLSGKENDPYDTFDYFMDKSEQINAKSRFYFIPAKKNDDFAYYNFDNKLIKKYIAKIKERQHIIGLHGSYNSFDNPDLYAKEKKRFEAIYGKVEENRQHFLRFAVPLTWKILEENNIMFDSSMGFTKYAGFRTGYCYPYKVFDILQRKTLAIKEIPLIVMEAGLYLETLDPEIFISELKKLNEIVKKYKGYFVLLWHNSSFFIPELKPIRDIYDNVINIIA